FAWLLFRLRSLGKIALLRGSIHQRFLLQRAGRVRIRGHRLQGRLRWIDCGPAWSSGLGSLRRLILIGSRGWLSRGRRRCVRWSCAALGRLSGLLLLRYLLRLLSRCLAIALLAEKRLWEQQSCHQRGAQDLCDSVLPVHENLGELFVIDYEMSFDFAGRLLAT